jgi:branched-subunit amino acid ABC-type transport system permease component
LAAEFADLVAFALMIAILFARPQGLLGRVPA